MMPPDTTELVTIENRNARKSLAVRWNDGNEARIVRALQVPLVFDALVEQMQIPADICGIPSPLLRPFRLLLGTMVRRGDVLRDTAGRYISTIRCEPLDGCEVRQVCRQWLRRQRKGFRHE